MFGFSLPKLLLLTVIILAVWYIFRFIERRETNLEKSDASKNSKWGNKPKKSESSDLEKCSKCGAYVSDMSGHSCKS